MINVKFNECKQTYRLLRGWKLCKIAENCDLVETSPWAHKVGETPPYTQKPFKQNYNDFFHFYEGFSSSSSMKRMWQRDFSLLQTTPRPYHANWSLKQHWRSYRQRKQTIITKKKLKKSWNLNNFRTRPLTCIVPSARRTDISILHAPRTKPR